MAFVSLYALPRLPNGKLDRRALPLPDLGRSRLGTPFVPPRTELERLLAEIWAGVLGIEAVGVDDDFFALGGDSILSMQIVGPRQPGRPAPDAAAAVRAPDDHRAGTARRDPALAGGQ